MKIKKYYNNKLFYFVCSKFPNYVDWEILSFKKLPFKFIKNFKNNININTYLKYNDIDESTLDNILKLYSKNDIVHILDDLTYYKKFSETFIETYYNYFKFESVIYGTQLVSEEFIEKHLINLDNKSTWNNISSCQILSEKFIEKYQDKVDWYNITSCQILSEEFIEKYLHKLSWIGVQIGQHLSNEFLEKHYDKLDLKKIIEKQKLYPSFLVKHFEDICKNDLLADVVKFQKLDDDFIRKYIIIRKCIINSNEKYVISRLIKYQKLSPNLINDYRDLFKHEYKYEFYNFNKINDLYVFGDNWLYKDTKFKKQQIIDTGLYECYDDYFIAYKAIRQDRYSYFNFQYKYEPGKIYEEKCNCTNIGNSFGLNVGTYKYAKNYGGNKSIIIKCKIRYEDVGRLVHNNKKVRCFKIEILT